VSTTRLSLLFFIVTSAAAQNTDNASLAREVSELRSIVNRLEARLAQLETGHEPIKQPPAPPPAPREETASPLQGSTLNFTVDGYYSYNTNAPIGRANLLRAYDVSSNSFSLNQAAVVWENAADPEHGKRWGSRLDLQFGQATQTLQGNAANEPRPDIYRAVFQAYGTYVIPAGKGLTVDFGKFASSLGIENNYGKDQMNYSRSYFFNALPFYHMGLRATYPVSSALTLNYWMVNGTQQTEAFNGFKDQFFGLALQPHKNVTWNVNYYLGQEHPDVVYYPNGGPANLPTLQGIPFQPIRPAPTGKLHVFDSYVTWNVSPRLTLAAEGDYVIQRLLDSSAPAHIAGGAGYVRYQLTPRLSLATRAEYLSDRGGTFSGQTQALKETTLTLDYRIAEGFLLRPEWRRDFSNHPYFLTSELGRLKKEQNTIGVGLIWWFGEKKGAW
jgi:hypothetical protein